MNKEELREKRNRTIETLDDIKAVLGLDELYIDELEKELTELKTDLNEKENTVHTLDVLHKEAVRKYGEVNDQLTKAIEILKKYHNECPSKYSFEDIDDMAEQFISEVEE